jgi:hypothetical protein
VTLASAVAWHRERIGAFVAPVSLDHEPFLAVLRAYGLASGSL